MIRSYYVLMFILVFTIGVNAQTWTKKVNGGGLGNSLCYNPQNLNTIYGSPNTSTLWVSYDHGTTWQQLSTISGGNGITSVAVSVLDTNIILVGQKGSGGSDRVMKSTNNGATWTQTWSGNFSFYGVPVEYKPQHPDTVLTMSGNSIYRSTDFGSTWTIISTSGGFNVWCDAEINPADARIVLIGDNTVGIWKSTDSGVTWAQKHTTTGEIPMIAWNPFKPHIAYATKWSGGGGFVKSTDYGETWQSIATFSGVSMWSVSTSATDPGFVMACSYSGQNMRFSSDDGVTWQLQNTGLANSGYGALAVDANGLFALQGDGIYKFNSAPPPLPSVPTLVSPTNGAINQSKTPTLTWNASSNATSYRLQLATDSLFTVLVLDDSAIVATSRLCGPLADTTRYYWRVRGKNTTGSSAYSSTWNFRTTATVETRTNLTPDGGGYMYSSSSSAASPRPAYDWFEAGPGNGTFVAGTNSDDYVSAPISLPQQFYFYGAMRTQLRVCTNGWLTFNVSDSVPSYSETQIPNIAQPNLTVAPLWDDLRNHTGVASSGIYTRIVGARFIVEWYKMRRYPPGTETDTLTYQVVLDAGDSTISISYATPSTGGFVYGAATTESSIGIEGDGTGTNGSNYYFHGDKPLNLPTNGVLVKFALRQSLLNPTLSGSISGKKLRDLDGLNATTGDRSPLANWMIWLYRSGVKVDSQSTNAQGLFSFSGLALGVYDVVEDSGHGWVHLESIPGTGGTIQSISTARLRVALSSGDSSYNNTFVNFEPALIAGRKLQDFDSDSLTASDRLPLANWKIWRYTETNTLLDSTLTDSLGYFYFRNLPGGDFHLVEDTAGGWIPFPPILGTGAQHTTVVNYITIDVKFDVGDTTTGSTFINYYPGLTLLSPNGGEVWFYGSAHDIRWAGSQDSLVKLECSTDGGASWALIADNLPDSVHKYTWIVPNTPSKNTKVRISEMPDSIHSDLSNASFIIQSTITSSMHEGWNLLSVPLAVGDNRASALYPTAASLPFRYQGSYAIAETLYNGDGFWIKYDSSNAIGVTGAFIESLTVNVRQKWNIIGSLSSPILTSDINESVGGLVVTPYYGFETSYQAEDTLIPGKGYWVKTSQAGQLGFSTAPSIGAFARMRHGKKSTINPSLPNSLEIIDALGNRQMLMFSGKEDDRVSVDRYELPPLPPQGMFDVRFAPRTNDVQGGTAEVVSKDRENIGSTILLHGVHFPVVIRYDLEDDAEFALIESSARHVLAGKGSLRLTSPTMSLRLIRTDESARTIPTAFALDQNYPNPFNPTTRVRFSVPITGGDYSRSTWVILKVYDLLGREVITLVNESKPPGVYEIAWDASSVPGGVYFCRMQAGGFTTMKRMILMK